jgi:hypothetical protein
MADKSAQGPLPNACITIPRHSKVLSGSRGRAFPQQRPDLRVRLALTRRRSGGSSPSAPTDNAWLEAFSLEVLHREGRARWEGRLGRGV